MAESMQGLKRTHRCTEVSTANIGQEVTVMGWVQKSRNKGGIIFVDLRDRSGLLQIIFEESDCGAESFAKAEKLRSEFVIAVTGTVEARSGGVNENLATGAIEVRAKSLRTLAESETPPFPVEEGSKTKEELRLKYRYLDLRRPDLQKNIMTRSRVAVLTRAFLAEEGFLEIETPTLIGSTPEGARDYLVPSRVHPGSFYALPQSPQLYKQLLMCSGYDRYFQLARCYRDEDLRADRQPEFTQIDLSYDKISEPAKYLVDQPDYKRLGGTAHGYSNFSSGVGFLLTYDSRDIPANAYKGIYLDFRGLMYQKFLGGDNNFYRLEVDYRQYKKVGNRKVIAWTAQTKNVFGDVPMNQYALSGTPFDLRGYYMGQYRDKSSHVVLAEYRQMFNTDKSTWVKRMLHHLGFVAWGGCGFMGPTMGKIEGVLPNAGVGLRIEVQPRMNVRLDFGRNFANDQSLFYFNMTEAF